MQFLTLRIKRTINFIYLHMHVTENMLPFWAAAPKGQCPVGHRGEFPDVLKGSISGLRRLMEVIEDGYEVWRADFWPEKQF